MASPAITLATAVLAGDEARVIDIVKKSLGSLDSRDEVSRFWVRLGVKAQCALIVQDGCTPLMKAAQLGHSSITKYLLGRGATVDAANKVPVTFP